MDASGVTRSGAQGGGNTSRGDRDGASEGSGSRDPGGIPPRQKRRAGSTTSECGINDVG